jgi:hypothetical protein
MFKWLEDHSLPCAYKYLLGIDCPLCGSQRATFFLLRGELIKSFQMYPPLIPGIAAIRIVDQIDLSEAFQSKTYLQVRHICIDCSSRELYNKTHRCLNGTI